MTLEENMRYETFVRKVHGNCGRWKDHLGLATTDINNQARESGDLSLLRLGVAYTVRRIQQLLEIEVGETGDVHYRLGRYVLELMSSSVQYQRIHQIIEAAEAVFDERLKAA
ncbi:MAG: hypothetical protein CVV27_02940 [Candidatus Melainabacteria bacterium HGW-Melainabacteria-1]|nr:MAG: hypothetical protein CVV27_02940 [Candidatus Melainabacteria bacterium HGW-Melainabacteria-1]